jgi:hypothetical protein
MDVGVEITACRETTILRAVVVFVASVCWSVPHTRSQPLYAASFVLYHSIVHTAVRCLLMGTYVSEESAASMFSVHIGTGLPHPQKTIILTLLCHCVMQFRFSGIIFV